VRIAPEVGARRGSPARRVPRRPDPLTGGCRETEEFERYDLRSDPFQLQNLYSSEDPTAGLLEDRLAKLRDCSGIEGRDPFPDEVPYCE
jgi:hypothetical protein